MSIGKLLAAGMIAGAITAAAGASAMEPAADKEKCYGVVKAGKNDCAAADKSHACMGGAKTDASPQEWVTLPRGLCEKLAGGSLTPGDDGKTPAKTDE